MLSNTEKEYIKNNPKFNKDYQATLRSRIKKKIKETFDDFRLISGYDNEVKQFLLDKLNEFLKIKF